MEDDPTESRNSEYEFAELEEAQGVMNDANEVPEYQPNAIEDMEPLNDEGIILVWHSIVLLVHNKKASFRF